MEAEPDVVRTLARSCASAPHAAFASSGTSAYSGSDGSGIPMRRTRATVSFVPDGSEQADDRAVRRIM